MSTSAVSAADRDEQIVRLCAAERAAVCDLAQQTGFRATLIRIASDQHRLVLTNHHIVLDGWSVTVLLQEVFAGYYGQRLPAAVPYRRFVSWLADRDVPRLGRPGERRWRASALRPWSARQTWGWGRETLPRFGFRRRPRWH